MSPRVAGCVDVSVVIPAYNESENLGETLAQLRQAFAGRPESWEVVFVDDGSTDDTRAVAERLAGADAHVVVAGYRRNAGRGRALRTGFARARGCIVVSIDADLSYRPAAIFDLVDALHDDPEVDLVIGSPYMPGGGTVGVDPLRLLISRLANLFLRATLTYDIHTFTGIFRAYRREVLEAVDLESDGKELHLEILSRAMGAGFKVKEVPAVLGGRAKGVSKFRFGGTALSHLLFSFNERPALAFGALGLLPLLGGIAGGVYVSALRFQGELNPGRPLITLVVILVLGGLQILSFGFVALQIGVLRREVFKLQREARLTRRRVDEVEVGRGGD